MNGYFRIKLLTVIFCNIIGTGLCGSLFGFDFLPPIKDIDTGFEKISQPVIKQNKNVKKANDPFASLDSFSSEGNIFKPHLFTPRPPIDFVDSFKAPPVFKQKNKANDPFSSFDPSSSKDNLFKPNLSTTTTTSPAPIAIVDHLKMVPELPLGFIKKLAKDEKNSNKDPPVKLDSRGSFGSDDDDSPASKSTERTTKESISEGTGDSFVTLAWQDIGTDYTTETSEYETTTDDEGHIGGPAPAVIASLLG